MAGKVKELNKVADKILITKIIPPKRNSEKPLLPHERKKLKEQKIATANSEALVSDFQFNPEEILNKILIFDLKKTSEEKILDRLIEKISKDNGKYYIEHREGANSFTIRQDKNQRDKKCFFNLIQNTDKKIFLALQKTRKTAIVVLNRTENFAISKLKQLGEKYVDEWE